MNSTLAAAALAACGSLLPGTAALAQQTSAPEAQVNALEGLFGKQSGARRSQAKGICATGHFVGNVDGQGLSSAAVFSGEKIPVIARFSVGGGNPKASDKSRSVRGLALQFNLPNGERWQMANISAPVFFVSRPEQFAGFMQARSADPATGKPDPAKLKAFNDTNPDTTRQGAYIASAPIPASYAAVNYWGVNAFEFVNAQRVSKFVRWQFAPVQGVLGLSDEQLKSMPDEFLADELRQRVATTPAVFDFKLQLAEAADNLTDPTQAWPDSRRSVSVGQLLIERVEASGSGACEKLTFDPLVLPAGIKPSADPVLLARSAPYVISLSRRLAEAAR
jgi:catalase